MLTQTPVRQQRISAPAWALMSGTAGLGANVLLVLFFLLAEPFGVSGPLFRGLRHDFSWLGLANDWVIVVQFLTFIPVALALPRWLPAQRSVRLATGTAVVAMIAVAVLQLLLISGIIGFDLQVLLVVAAFLLVYGWVLSVSSIGHRHGALPRTVTRFGLLLGAAYPVGLVIAIPGLIFPQGSAAQLAFVVPGLLIGALGWLGLPLWPLVLARRVFHKDPQHLPNEKGMS